MNKSIACTFAFTIGVLGGVFATRSYFKKKYEDIAQEEIDSVKEVFSKRNPAKEVLPKRDFEKDSIDESEQQSKPVSILSDYKTILHSKEYSKSAAPYVISPDEFGEIEEYEKISLSYYADGILADENDDVVDDIDAIIGLDSLNHFGEFEEDSVFVRNDAKECDYEILRDARNYSDIRRI